MTFKRMAIVFPVFLMAFLIADYLLTGSVTHTWIGIAVIAASLATMVKVAHPQ